MSKHRNCAVFQETRKSDNGGQNSLGHLSMIVVLQTLGKLAICLQVLDRKLNVPELSRTLGRRQHMRIRKPRVLKVS